MDPSRGRQQHIYKSYKSSNHQYNQHFDSNNYHTPSNHGYFRPTRIQKHSLKWQKDHVMGSYRPRNTCRRNDVSSRKSGKSSEDAEEEERKKKLNDTAKKLLTKIKTWNAEQNVSEESSKAREDSQQSGGGNQVLGEVEPWPREEKVSGDSKKRIAHSRKAKLIKNRTPKRLRQPVKAAAKYDVNKATVKDFQSRIQHKLIEEIMQMPKENLQNVLNDPKINPIMGLKMSRLVQENRPLITQKLRALAESKMRSLGFASNSQLLVDIDKLIDPVIETDLSALPYELIKQMENLFQVQFDYSESGLEQAQVGAGICDGVESGGDQEMAEVSSPVANDGVQSSALQEDLSMYECSTDEDEEISGKNPALSGPELASALGLEVLPFTESMKAERDVEMGFEGEGEMGRFGGSDNKGGEQQRPEGESLLPGAAAPVPEEATKIVSSSGFTPSCQANSLRADMSTQTTEEVGALYGVPLPKQSQDNSTASLLEEVNSIQNLTNKLNERRLWIFLELSRMNPEGNFIGEERTRQNFAETLSNGSVCLLGALEKFLQVRAQRQKKNSDGGGSKSPNKCVSKSKSKNRESR